MTSPSDDRLLQEALDASPGNVPLRLLVAKNLSVARKSDDAEAVLKDGLVRFPDNADLKLALSQLYLSSGKHSMALVVCESITSERDPPSAALVLLARLLHLTGETERASRVYRQAVAVDPEAIDQELEAAFGPTASAVPVSAGASRSDLFPGEVEQPKLRFADVGGMEAVKEEIRLKIIQPLTHAELFRSYGKAIGGGLLMYGPPGCGKTHLARATAGEVNAGFVAVGLHDILNMWTGNSEKNLTPCSIKLAETGPACCSSTR